jgi:diacylglycerol kinase family enzyme
MSAVRTGTVEPMHALLVVNPFATRVTDRKLAAVEKELGRVTELTVVKTAHRAHATELVTQASRDGYDAVIVFSGDGVFNEALNGLHGEMPIGFIPGGGTSVLPRALGLPAEPVAAARRLADAIERGRTRRITLGRVNGRRFSFSAGIGLDAAAVRRVDEMGRREDGKRPGDFAFALAVVRVLASNRGRLETTLELRDIGRAAFVFVANGSPYTYAKWIPLPFTPEAEFELGLDFVAPVHVRRRSLVRLATLMLSGHSRSGPVLYGHDLDRLEVRCDYPMPLHVDGEDLGDVESAVFEAERAAVSVFV